MNLSTFLHLNLLISAIIAFRLHNIQSEPL